MATATATFCTERGPISESGLARRVNRFLIARGRRLVKTRGRKDKAQFGEYCIVNGGPGYQYIFDSSSDLGILAHRLGVI